jgi:5'-methylthioadenosine phosphorylase
VGHVAFGDPVCAVVAQTLAAACEAEDLVGKSGGTYVCMEGPQFSTRAESNLYRSWGADVIGMTNLQEAKLAREAEICYATVAMVTDYDCWHEGHDSVTVDQIVAVLNQNAANAAKVVKAAVAAMPRERNCPCAAALKFAILTNPEVIPAGTREKLELLIGKYMNVTAKG